MDKAFRPRIGKYVFEVSVIFIGITLSFLFEEWRTNREKAQRAKAHLIEIKEEALFIRKIASIYDSTVKAEIIIMDSLIGVKDLTNSAAFELLKLAISNRDFSISYKLRELPTLKATGEISLINGDVVTMLELLQVAADKIEGPRYDASIYDQLMRSVIQNTKYVSDKSSSALTMDYSRFMKSSQGITELVTWRTREKRAPLYNLKLLKDRCEELIEMVDKEIGEY
jgi:hypothetical protein